MRIRSDQREARDELAATIRRLLPAHEALVVLEAGGGSLSHVPFPGGASVTVIDISPDQLARNEHAHQKILGDLHTYPFEPSSFDMIVCWDVLEHLERPHDVVRSFARWARPGGLIVIAAPNPRSLNGLITRFTPHWFHVWVLRSIFRSRTAGLPGFAPFPTVTHRSMYPDALASAFEREGCEIRYLRLYRSMRVEDLQRSRPWIGRAYAATLLALRAATLGRWNPEYSDFLLLAQSRPGVEGP